LSHIVVVKGGHQPKSKTMPKSTTCLLLALFFFLYLEIVCPLQWWGGGGVPRSVVKKTSSVEAERVENELLSLLLDDAQVGGRGKKTSSEAVLATIEQGIAKLESLRGVVAPTKSPLIDGTWQLLFTSSPGTNSPIQRTLTGYDGVSVYQVINLLDTTKSFLPEKLPDVSNTVVLGSKSRLRVTAIASTKDNKLVEPRVGDGKFFGFAPFGSSSSAPPRDDYERIDFAFQEARFERSDFPPSVGIPYPVPFKLLGDEAKGWIDNTYLSESGRFRIARGNKGTCFVLLKVDTTNDLRAACAAANFLESTSSPSPAPAVIPSSSASKIRLNAKKSSKTSLASSPATSSVIIFPQQFGTQGDYEALETSVQNMTGLSCFTAPLRLLDWPIGLAPTFFSKDYVEAKLKPSKALRFYFERVDEAVQSALSKTPDTKLVILAHSIGGWLARAWLSEWCAPDVKARVSKIVTLGSPHNPPPQGSRFEKIDQTRGLLTHINDNYPGAFEQGVSYTSVIGTCVQGRLALSPLALLAYSSYAVLCGEGSVKGDGVIPVESAILSGSKQILIDTAFHTNFLPVVSTIHQTLNGTAQKQR